MKNRKIFSVFSASQTTDNWRDLMACTLSLTDDWDITLTASGRLAVKRDAAAVAQNVANATRLFTGDACFNRTDGVPHFITELGRKPRESVVRSRLNAAARAVPEVADASTAITRLEDRVLEGAITITTTEGDTIHVAI